MNKNKIFYEKIIDYLLRRKTLISILFILSAFLIRELTAYSNGDSITEYCNNMLVNHSEGFMFYFFSTIKAIFSAGSLEVIIITTLLLILFSFLKYFEIKEGDNRKYHLASFISISICLVAFLFFSFVKSEKILLNDKPILLDPLISMKYVKSDEGIDEAVNQYLRYKNNLTPELDNKIYEEIITKFKEDGIKSCESRIIEVFELSENTLSNDELLGYVIASYFGQKKFDEAAKLVLERNLNYQNWDHSLKLDFAKCIRFYSLQNGFLSGFELVDSLLVSYPKNNIVSKLWAVIPYEDLVDIEKGMYNPNLSIDPISLNNIKYILSNFPEDHYCSYGYYILEEVDNARSCKENVRIEDILKYSEGFDIVETTMNELITKYEHKNGQYWFYDDYEYISDEEYQDKRLDSATQFFKTYTRLYPTGYHLNDSYLWLAWINAQKHDFIKALESLNRIDFANVQENTKRKVLNFKAIIYNYLGDIDIKEDVAKTYKENNEQKLDKFTYLNAVFDNLDFESQISLALSNKVDIDFLFDRLSKHYKFETASNFILWYEMLETLSSIESYEYELYEYTCVYEVFKSDFKDLSFEGYLNHANINCIKSSTDFYIKYLEKGLDNFQEPKNREHLIYLLVRNLVDYSPKRVIDYLDLMKEELPESDLLDDIYAETVFTYYNSLYNEEKGELILQEMIDEYSNKKNNALDNALYWAVIYYLKEGYYSDNNNSKLARQKYKKYRKLFFELYPTSLEDFSKEDVEEVLNYLW